MWKREREQRGREIKYGKERKMRGSKRDNEKKILPNPEKEKNGENKACMNKRTDYTW